MDNYAKQGAELQVTYLPVADLTPYKNNARKHSKAQIRQIADSIQAFGFTNPVLIDDDYQVIAGHGRVAAAKLLGMTALPTIFLSHLTKEQKQAYIIADNRLAEKSGWDKDMLATELQGLMTLDLDFSLSVTGFDLPQIDLMVHDLEEKDPDDGDELPPIPDTPVALPGDLWILGCHRIYCGSSLETASYTALMNGELAQMVFTDPPYNVPIAGHVSGKGKVVHDEFAMASGEMTPEAFTAFLHQAMKLMAANSQDGALHYHCMDWRHIAELLQAAKVYTDQKNLCVWAKDNGGMGSLYRSQHELVFVFKHGTGAHINNVELGKHGRNRTNVWHYRGVNTLRKGRAEELAMHPTVKPVRLVADALQDASHRGGLVLDPFGGSGTTLIAAEKIGRCARLIELEPKYVDVTVQRWQALTGKQAVHATTGQTYAERKDESNG